MMAFLSLSVVFVILIAESLYNYLEFVHFVVFFSFFCNLLAFFCCLFLTSSHAILFQVYNYNVSINNLSPPLPFIIRSKCCNCDGYH